MKIAKWIGVLLLLGFVGYGVVVYFRAGYDTRPAMPEGAWSLSFKSGLRGIVVDVGEDDSRRYLGLPMDVPFYLKDSWSWCHPAKDGEIAQAQEFMAERDWPGQRFEAVCKIDVEGKEVVRGLIISVPRV